MRKYYLDNIRWATILLVMAYHVFYAFNAVGVLGGVGGFAQVQYQDAFLYFVYPWFMVLLFVIAGISARYALDKYSGKASRSGISRRGSFWYRPAVVCAGFVAVFPFDCFGKENG
ncbi:MAG: hypothetical protein OSJ72_10715 [Lachnospiraceae bacterium]|nr:hypothetical protein [Lachnospiraceae bacterium]